MNWVQEKFFSKELEAEYIGIDVASAPDEACGALIKDGQTVAIIRGGDWCLSVVAGNSPRLLHQSPKHLKRPSQ